MAAGRSLYFLPILFNNSFLTAPVRYMRLVFELQRSTIKNFAMTLLYVLKIGTLVAM
jgi:hypothetical protein